LNLYYQNIFETWVTFALSSYVMWVDNSVPSRC